jgi:hypothetical protein
MVSQDKLGHTKRRAGKASVKQQSLDFHDQVLEDKHNKAAPESAGTTRQGLPNHRVSGGQSQGIIAAPTCASPVDTNRGIFVPGRSHEHKKQNDVTGLWLAGDSSCREPQTSYMAWEAM